MGRDSRRKDVSSSPMYSRNLLGACARRWELGRAGVYGCTALCSLCVFTSPLHRSRPSSLLPLSPVPEAAAVLSLYLERLQSLMGLFQ